MSDSTIKPATFTLRLIAYLIDYGIILFFIWLLSFAKLPPAVSGLIGMMISAAYFIFLEQSPWQASLGKKLLGIRLASVSGTPKVTLDQASMRYIIVHAGILLSIFLSALDGSLGKDMIAPVSPSAEVSTFNGAAQNVNDGVEENLSERTQYLKDLEASLDSKMSGMDRFDPESADEAPQDDESLHERLKPAELTAEEKDLLAIMKQPKVGWMLTNPDEQAMQAQVLRELRSVSKHVVRRSRRKNRAFSAIRKRAYPYAIRHRINETSSKFWPLSTCWQ